MISLANGSGRNTRTSATSANASSNPHHHLKTFIANALADSVLEIYLARFGLDLLALGQLRHDATFLQGVDLVGDGAHQRQVLLDDYQRRLLAQLFEYVAQVHHDAGG